MKILKNCLLAAAIPTTILIMSSCTTSDKNAGGAGPFGPNSVRYKIEGLTPIGKDASGKEWRLGGFSGLQYLGTENGNYLFASLTDRGPNADEKEMPDGETHRPFLLPDYQPRLVFFRVDPKAGRAFVTSELPLKNTNGTPITGRPNQPGDEMPVDMKGAILPRDPNGIDAEGVAVAEDGTYWLGEEYGPSLLHFSKKGDLIERYSPGKGLPEALKNRKLNRGFEAVAMYKTSVFAMLQSPIPQKKSEKKTKPFNVRIVEFDASTKTTIGQYLYVLDGDNHRIGDMIALPNRELLILEHDSKFGEKGFKKVYRAALGAASNLQDLTPEVANSPLDGMDAAELGKAQVAPVLKTEVVDLIKEKMTYTEKPEGLAMINESTLVIANDNDFGVFPGEGDTSYLLFVTVPKR